MLSSYVEQKQEGHGWCFRRDETKRGTFDFWPLGARHTATTSVREWGPRRGPRYNLPQTSYMPPPSIRDIAKDFQTLVLRTTYKTGCIPQGATKLGQFILVLVHTAYVRRKIGRKRPYCRVILIEVALSRSALQIFRQKTWRRLFRLFELFAVRPRITYSIHLLTQRLNIQH